MIIEFTEYARDSINDRKIEEDLIKEALSNPDENVKGKLDREIAHKIINGKLLRIIYQKNNGPPRTKVCGSL